MQISQSSPAGPEIIRDVPTRLLTTLAEGQRVQATVIARVTPEWVKLRVADTVLQLKTAQDLQPGQQLELQRGMEAGKPVLKPVLSMQAMPDKALETALLTLKQGQQLAIEVVKVLAQNRVLAQPALLSQSAMPRQIEIDTSALGRIFRPGERLAMEVVAEQPLAIRLRADNLSRAQLIQSNQRSLLPMVDRQMTSMAVTANAATAASVTRPVQAALNTLIQYLGDKSGLQQADTLKQTLNNSGLFLENRLKTGDAPLINQDLKANLLKLARVVKSEIQQQAASSQTGKTLPTDIQAALKQLSQAPQELRLLPSTILAALQSKGQTPIQMLLNVLSGLKPGATPPVAATEPRLSSVQQFINAKAAVQAPTVSAEWQLLRDLLREVENVSSRIQLNQLSMLKDPDGPSNVNVWLFDIPVKDRQQLEMMQLKLEQHLPQSGADGEAVWQVQLNLETQNLGPMQARISLFQSDVKVVLLAEHQHSADMLTRHMDALNQRLVALGVNVSHLSCRQQRVSPLTAPIIPDAAGSHLLDISV